MVRIPVSTPVTTITRTTHSRLRLGLATHPSNTRRELLADCEALGFRGDLVGG